MRWRYTWADGRVRGVDVFRVRVGVLRQRLVSLTTHPESEAEQRLFNRHVQARSIVVEPALAVAFLMFVRPDIRDGGLLFGHRVARRGS